MASRRADLVEKPAADRFETIVAAFCARFGRPPVGLAEAPGRVNLIGEHTDYNQGFVLPVAIDRTVAVAFAPREDGRVRAHSLDFDQEDEFALADIGRREGDSWANYLRGVALILQQAGHQLSGLDLVVQGEVPIGAGLSSSAALEVATLGAFATAADLALDDRDKALLAQRAENEFVGVACGVMDQMAAVFGRTDHALRIDCRSLETEAVPLNLEAHNLRIVVANTGVRRALTASAYNQRRQECSRAVELLFVLLRGRRPRSLRDITLRDLTINGRFVPEDLLRRARHVVSENARVLATVDALQRGDLAEVGRLFYASHESLAHDYEVSSPELDLMVELACLLEGVVGARMTGAGFGGCTVNLVRADAVEDFRQHVIEVYRARTGLPGEMYVCRAVDGLRTVRC
jgi:galactokinase